ncbi:hypothetical protein niasHT_032883 [Heterodera trifolii]|uniref:F-box domain-containing protein n=1 Tax=Heterodera trifolii TaxID=157864 RepID=A0ABD2ISQ5_9BILA
MSDNGKEAEEKMAKAIFLCDDCWLKVFELLSPRQLGLGIALVSHRFHYLVGVHFKSRKWTLNKMEIRSRMGENGTNQMEIVNARWRPLPIPQVQVPHNVIGFEWIEIKYIDKNAIAFLGHFRQLFTKCPIKFDINTGSDHLLAFILRNIWPMLGKNVVEFRVLSFHDNAMPLDGQAVFNWLFTPRPDNVPKVFSCCLFDDANLAPKIDGFKSAFASASSSVNFIVSVCFEASFAYAFVPFHLTNDETGEQLALKRTNSNRCFLLVRCPIGRDADKWAKWEEEAIGWEFLHQWNRINIEIELADKIGDGLLTAMPGPSDQQQQND